MQVVSIISIIIQIFDNLIELLNDIKHAETGTKSDEMFDLIIINYDIFNVVANFV